MKIHLLTAGGLRINNTELVEKAFCGQRIIERPVIAVAWDLTVISGIFPSVDKLATQQ
ncbi:Uncharacterised protein [Vibrio cholerae]|uniref:Uncharacterized protein n=1 Tax=Vibrio cholerae TaxID=666 RepID=A0A655QHV0_VIBCL|nr:Uncharacterised protein [Vibrio cholerae]